MTLFRTNKLLLCGQNFPFGTKPKFLVHRKTEMLPFIPKHDRDGADKKSEDPNIFPTVGSSPRSIRVLEYSEYSEYSECSGYSEYSEYSVVRSSYTTTPL
jgi:hypothetical protein